MHSYTNDINIIIARILSKEAEIDEIFVFNDWLNQKEENKQQFLLLKSLWEVESIQFPSLCPEIACERFLQRVAVQEKRRRMPRLITFSIAANIALLMGICSALFFLMRGNPEPVETFVYQSASESTSFELQDGTQVKLNKGSRLTFKGDFGKENRIVQLEGEAYFDVTKDPNRVFKIEMNKAVIEVRGTKFNVSAYHADPDITATLEEGSIQFNAKDKKIMLIPNQQLVLDKQSGEVDVKTVDANDFSAWKDRLYRYHSITMQDLSTKLEEIYNVEIIVPPSLRQEKISGSFIYEQPLGDVLNIMMKSLNFKWEKHEDTIIIKSMR